MSVNKKRHFIGLGIFTILLIGGMVAVMVYLNSVRSTHSRQIASIYQDKKVNPDRLRLMNRTILRRATFFRQKHFLEMPQLITFSSANLISRLCRSLPDTVCLYSLEIRPVNQALAFSMAGSVTASDRQQAIFKSFLDSLDSIENLMEKSFRQIYPDRRSESQSPAVENGQPAVGEKKSLEFIIEGMVELE